MNINEMLSWPMVMMVVILLVGIAFAMFMKERSPLSIGGMAVPVALFTGIGFIKTDLPSWTAVAVLLTTLLLFAVGITRSKEKDDPWHYGAMAVALFGKLLIWTLSIVGPLVLEFLKWGFNFEIRFYGWMFALLFALMLGALLFRSSRIKKLTSKLRRSKQVDPVTDPAAT